MGQAPLKHFVSVPKGQDCGAPNQAGAIVSAHPEDILRPLGSERGGGWLGLGAGEGNGESKRGNHESNSFVSLN